MMNSIIIGWVIWSVMLGVGGLIREWVREAQDIKRENQESQRLKEQFKREREFAQEQNRRNQERWDAEEALERGRVGDEDEWPDAEDPGGEGVAEAPPAVLQEGDGPRHQPSCLERRGQPRPGRQPLDIPLQPE